MPQNVEINLPDGAKGMVIYPDGKTLKIVKYQEEQHNVVVHYQTPHKPEIADASPSDPYLFVVPSALVPGLK